MSAQLLLVSVAVFSCLLELSSCNEKKKILVKVPHVIKHIHHTHLEPVHIHKIHHQKKNHHHQHEKSGSAGESGWESRSNERARVLAPSWTQDSEDHLLDSYEYGRESFWDGGSAQGRVKRRRQPAREDSLEEPIKLSNVEAPVWVNRAQGNYGEEWQLPDEHRSGGKEHRGYRGREEPVIDQGRQNNDRMPSWRSNQEGGWRPVTDYTIWDEERARGREPSAEKNYSYSAESLEDEYQDYRPSKEKPGKKGKKKDEQKTKWSKQIKQGELIDEEDVQRLINSLQRDQYQQQQIDKQKQIHQQQLQQQQQLHSSMQQPQMQSRPELQVVQQALYRAHSPTALPILQVPAQHTPESQQPDWSPPIHPKKPEQQWPSQRTQLTTHSPKMAWSGLHLQLPQTTMWHVQQLDVGSTSGLPVQVISSSHSNPASVPKPYTHHQTFASYPLRHQVLPAQPQTLGSDSLRNQALHAQPQTLVSDPLRQQMLPAQPQTLASDSLRSQALHAQPQTLVSGPLRQQMLPAQPQTLASDPLRHQVLPPAGWPLDHNQRDQGVKQTWHQSVETSGRDGPASSYKVEVINYSNSKRS